MLQKVELGSNLRNVLLQLATLKFVAWQVEHAVVIRAITRSTCNATMFRDKLNEHVSRIGLNSSPRLSYRRCVIFKDDVTVFFFLLNRTGARDSENASLTLGDLASLFTQDEERDEEQCMTGSFGFHEETDELSPG